MQIGVVIFNTLPLHISFPCSKPETAS